MMESRAEIKNILGWATDDSGSGMKFF